MQPYISSIWELARLYVSVTALGGTSDDIRKGVNVGGYDAVLYDFELRETGMATAIALSEMCPDWYAEMADHILAGMVNNNINGLKADPQMFVVRKLTPFERDIRHTAQIADEVWLTREG